MFNISSSSSIETRGKTDRTRTRTITIAYADAKSYSDVSISSNNESSSSSSSLQTPSTVDSTPVLLEQLEREQEKEKFFGYHPIWREMSLSDGTKLKTLEYLLEYKVFQLFNFMMTHLLAHSPEDPVSFLVSLLDRCIRYRDEAADPPLVFEDSHIHSVYVALDPLLEGTISHSQYLVGMKTLGLTEFNVLPNNMEDHRNVAKDVFVKEAKLALIMQLDRILGKEKEKSSMVENVINYSDLGSQQ
ncbi:uncharacterized protein LOC128990816 [Macrosteles quadrilineatus]|uniref:uncharacterized protein LOC128990816 n=1 Tax=Macrosteles quadrilineatus TaxID=74068 RepID=UPI0023E232E6|nr:uncharacterized protein LOC128990816 [Macrosteles quadrilineatus]